MFIDNTGGVELTRRLLEAEVELGMATGFRGRMSESVHIHGDHQTVGGNLEIIACDDCFGAKRWA